MSNNITLARPYAKAIFEHALATDTLDAWALMLEKQKQIASDEAFIRFVQNPSVSPAQQAELIYKILQHVQGELTDKHCLHNFVELLAKNKRLSILPQVHDLFASMRAEHEKTLTVEVFSFAPLSGSQEEALIRTLEKRLNKKIALQISIDKNLLGGAVIIAGQLVIDGSVRGKLEKLKAKLAA